MYGATTAIARVLATGSHTEVLGEPMSTVMKVNDPPTKYSIICEPAKALGETTS